MLYTGTQNRQSIRINRGGEDDYMDIPPFAPDPGLIQAVNQSISTTWPLLIRGDTSMGLRAVYAICYELFGPEFSQRYFAAEMGKFQSTVGDLLYHFDHERRKRDLEYHRLDPENNPVKPVADYLTKEVLIGMLEFESKGDERPVLNIRNIHKAEKTFVTDLMDLLLVHRFVKIHETGEEYIKRYGLPFLFLTADQDYQLPDKRDYHGIIYTYDLTLSREFLLENCKLEFAEILQAEPAMEPIIENLIELFGLVEDFASVSKVEGSGQSTYLELANAIQGKWEAIQSGSTTADAVLEELTAVIAGQKAILKNLDVSAILPEIITAIRAAEFKTAFAKLEVIQQRLPGPKRTALNAFIIRYHDLKKKEMLGTESTLLLVPQTTQLMLDVLNFLEELG
ncbi:MAG: hypothetical protein EP344_07490 [Bacteroidetes bacterium]|nr:MAG: hypothetical protein EP344_07490 [Bacteroidota bacterium]